MMAATCLFFRLFLLSAAAVFVLVNGIVTQGSDYDLKIVSVTRAISYEDMTLETTLVFTASVKPEVVWTRSERGKPVSVADTTLEYGADGRGTAVATVYLHSERMRVSVDIGYLDSHFLSLGIGWKFGQDLEDVVTRELNTQLSTLSTGYDITYSDDESFDVSVTVPKHIAPGYTWSRFMDDEENDYNVRVEACYVDQETGAVLSSVDHIDDMETDKFLSVDKTFDDDQASLRLQFRTSEEDISGFFKIFVLSDYDDDEAPWFVDNIWEVAYINVHNSSTAGPFPRGYTHVRISDGSDEKWCDREEYCSPLYCYGFANNIVDAKIYKLGAEGSRTELTDLTVSRENSHDILFHAHIDTSGDFEGKYLCEITTSSGLEGSKTIEVNGY